MKAKALKFTKNHEFHGNTEMGIFHGRRPISRKMSRPWNRELGWSLVVMLPGTRTLCVMSLIHLLFLDFTYFDCCWQNPPPACIADRSDQHLFETRHLLKHASEQPASIRCQRLFENSDSAFITSFTVITKLISILCPDFAQIYHVCF